MVVAALAVALYVLFVRPTIIAERLVRDINAGDTTELMALRRQLDKDDWRFSGNYASDQTSDIYAIVLPRTWSDIFRSQRKILVNASYPKRAHGGPRKEEIGYFVKVGIIGLTIQQ
jgi:hypothetical protein